MDIIWNVQVEYFVLSCGGCGWISLDNSAHVCHWYCREIQEEQVKDAAIVVVALLDRKWTWWLRPWSGSMWHIANCHAGLLRMGWASGALGSPQPSGYLTPFWGSRSQLRSCMAKTPCIRSLVCLNPGSFFTHINFLNRVHMNPANPIDSAVVHPPRLLVAL